MSIYVYSIIGKFFHFQIKLRVFSWSLFFKSAFDLPEKWIVSGSGNMPWGFFKTVLVTTSFCGWDVWATKQGVFCGQCFFINSSSSTFFYSSFLNLSLPSFFVCIQTTVSPPFWIESRDLRKNYIKSLLTNISLLFINVNIPVITLLSISLLSSSLETTHLRVAGVLICPPKNGRYVAPKRYRIKVKQSGIFC